MQLYTICFVIIIYISTCESTVEKNLTLFPRFSTINPRRRHHSDEYIIPEYPPADFPQNPFQDPTRRPPGATHTTPFKTNKPTLFPGWPLPPKTTTSSRYYPDNYSDSLSDSQDYSLYSTGDSDSEYDLPDSGTTPNPKAPGNNLGNIGPFDTVIMNGVMVNHFENINVDKNSIPKKNRLSVHKSKSKSMCLFVNSNVNICTQVKRTRLKF